MKVLVINSGSSSIKYQLFDMADKRVLAWGIVEQIGESQSRLMHHTRSSENESQEIVKDQIVNDHRRGFTRRDTWNEHSQSNSGPGIKIQWIGVSQCPSTPGHRRGWQLGSLGQSMTNTSLPRV